MYRRTSCRWFSFVVMGCGLAGAAVFCPAREARAANNFFNVASGNYATNANWTLGTIPGNGNNDQPWIGTTVGGLTTAAATYNTATGYTTTGRFVVGLGATGNGTLNMNGSAGTLTFGGDNFGGANYVGVDGGTGFMNVDAGTLNISAGAYLWVGANGSGVGTLSVNGGTINMGTGSVLGLGTGNAAGANGTLNMNSGAINFSTTGSLVLNGTNAAGSAGTAVANLNGGIITTLSVASSGTGSATLNLAGGTLRANATNAAFISGMDTINVKNGGVTIDSNGFNIGVAQVLSHFAGATTDGLTKTGNGTLTLSAANTFNGNVVINGGTLASNLPAPLGASTSGGFGNLQVAGKTITVNSGATLLHGGNDLYFNSAAGFTGNTTKIVIAGGTLNSGTFYSAIKDLDIHSGGSITGTNGVNANFRSLALTGTVTTNGGSGVGSTIASPGGNGGIHLGHSGFAVSNVTFNVDAASGGLTISAPLYNQASALGPSGFTKTGSGTLTLTNTTSAFTGNVLIDQGQVVVNGGGLGLNPTTSALGNTQTAGRTITVSNATMAFTQHDVLGNAGSTPVVQLIISNGGDLQSQSKLTTLGPVTLDGGFLTADGDQNVGQFGNFNLNGTIIVTGNTQSELRSTNVTAGHTKFNLSNVGANTTTFNVGNGAAPVDLLVSGVLANNWSNAASGITKTGAGTMTLSAANTYTGTTTVNAGTLSVTGSITNSLNVNSISGGTLSVDGGTVTVGNGGNFSVGSSTAGAAFAVVNSGTLNIGGGTTIMGTTYIGGRINNAPTTGIGTLTINGGIVNVAAAGSNNNATFGDNTKLWLNPYATAGTSTLNLNGGILSTARGIQDGGGNNSLINFNGGTLQAAANIDLIPAVTTAAINAGGLTVDTQAFTASISKALTHGTGSPDGGLFKIGSGTLILPGANTFTGNLVINNGTVRADLQANVLSPNATSLGDMTVAGREIQVNSGGTLLFNANDPIGAVSLNPALTTIVVDGGTVSRTNAKFVTLPNMTLKNGATVTGGDGVFGTFQSYNLAGSVTVSGISGSTITTTGASLTGVHLGANTSFIVNSTGAGPDLTVSAPLIDRAAGAGAGGYTKSGAGTMLLTVANTYTGVSTVSNGVLELAANNALGTIAGNTVVNAGATLRLSVNSYSTAEPLTLNGTGYVGLAETGALLVDGVGVSRSFAGPITLGTNSTIGVYNGSTLTLTGGIAKAGNNVTFLGDGSSSKAIINTTGISGVADLIVDAMTVDLDVGNTYDGPTYLINGATLNANIANALPTAPARSAVHMDQSGSGNSTLALTASQSIASLTGAASSLVNLNANTLTIGTTSGSTTFAGIISGAGGALVKDGASTQVLTGPNTYSGSTTVSAGTLELAAPGVLQNGSISVTGGAFRQSGGTNNVTGASGGLTVAAGASYQLQGGTLNFGDYATVGSTAWTPADESTITLATGNQFQFTGGTLTDVSHIVVTDSSSFTQSGANSHFHVGQNGIGPAAETTINGGFSLLGGTLHLDVFGDDLTPEQCCDNVASQNDQLTVSGAAFLDSTISLNYVAGYEPEFGDVFTLLCADDIDYGSGFHIDGGFFRIVPATGDPNGPMALQAIVPEPASIAIWTTIALAGFAGVRGLRSKRKERRTK